MTSTQPTPTPRFTGIFIPVEVLEMDDLSLLEKVLLSWIDALYSKSHGGCFASNLYLSEKLNTQENTVSKAITKLRKKGLIEDVSFNGRQIVRRALINEYVSKEQSKADLDLNPMQTPIQGSIGEKSNPASEKNPKPSYIYSKGDSKVKEVAQPPKKGAEQKLDFYFSSSDQKFIGITENDVKAWKGTHPDIDISMELTKMVQWLIAHPSRANKKLWRKFVLGWLQRAQDKAYNKKSYQSQNSSNSSSKLRFEKEPDSWKPQETNFFDEV